MANAIFTEYRVYWRKLGPDNQQRVVFVEAQNGQSAITIARDYIERKHGITEFIMEEYDAAKPLPAGKVIESK